MELLEMKGPDLVDEVSPSSNKYNPPLDSNLHTFVTQNSNFT